ncbi:MAG: FAD synthetase family protein [Treponemataceae bacterium]|nr:FAD synthetase family protein [Treponemataceae bacterium]
MKVFSWEEVSRLARNGRPAFASSAVAIGGFDGMHLGHDALFSAVLDYRNSHPESSAGIVTFSRSPGVLKNSRYEGDVSTKRLKLEFFEKKGFDFCIMIDFSLDFSKIKGKDFLDIVRKFCAMQFLAAGIDFRMGHNSDTGVAELSCYARSCGLELKVLDDVVLKGKRVSSSLVRGAVREGDFDFASSLLGRPFCLDGLPLDFQEGGSSNATLSMIASRNTTQVLPEDGSFRVRVAFAGEDGYSQNVDAVLHVESSFLRLEFPPEQNLSRVERIEFISR